MDRFKTTCAIKHTSLILCTNSYILYMLAPYIVYLFRAGHLKFGTCRLYVNRTEYKIAWQCCEKVRTKHGTSTDMRQALAQITSEPKMYLCICSVRARSLLVGNHLQRNKDLSSYGDFLTGNRNG